MTGTQTYTQTDMQTETHAHLQTGRQTHTQRQTDTLIDRRTHTLVYMFIYSYNENEVVSRLQLAIIADRTRYG